MPIVRVAGATLNQTPLDFHGNKERIINVLQKARADAVDLICLPELCITGYGCEDAFFSMYTVRAAEAALKELLAATHGMAVILGLPHFHAGALYNCAVMVQDGRILGLNAKRVLPREGVHYEPRWFRPWSFKHVTTTMICGYSVPMGDVHYRLGDVGVAVEICEEAWDSAPASEDHAAAVDIIVNPSASHFAIGKYKKREQLVANSSRSLNVHYVYSNLLGCEAGRSIYDGGVLIAAAGRIAVRGARFGFHDGDVTWRDVGTDTARVAKLKGQPVKESYQEPRMPVEITGSPLKERSSATVDPPLDAAIGAGGFADDANEEFLAAEMLGLFDYLRKTKAKGFVLSLSGGCDSAVCAVLVAQMLAEALKCLGPEALQQRLGLDFTPQMQTPRELVARLLTCVYQATKNSSSVTKDAAESLAKALGASFHRVNVEPLVGAYTQLAEGVAGRTFTWQADDLTLQNIQSRSRAPLIWMIANAKEALLITTANRSEAAVGYATMDGDTAGGLAPIAGVDKVFLQQWLEFAQKRCRFGFGPTPQLEAVRAQIPTAELRPVPQTDEADLMPYPVLSCLERCLARDFLSPQDTLTVLKSEFTAVAEADLKAYLAKFYGLWARSQWKRERLAPSFYLADPSVDSRTACRYPIFSAPWGI
jgi:NAD+ synthase (glutamine-hydrolysing)